MSLKTIQLYSSKFYWKVIRKDRKKPIRIENFKSDPPTPKKPKS